MLGENLLEGHGFGKPLTTKEEKIYSLIPVFDHLLQLISDQNLDGLGTCV